MPCSIAIKSVVDKDEGVSSGLENSPMCTACEMIVKWVHKELAENQTRDSLLGLDREVSFLIFFIGI